MAFTNFFSAALDTVFGDRSVKDQVTQILDVFKENTSIGQSTGTLVDLRITAVAGAPVDGVTGAGTMGVGSFYINTTNGYAYSNTGTKASPVWSQMTSVEGS